MPAETNKQATVATRVRQVRTTRVAGMAWRLCLALAAAGAGSALAAEAAAPDTAGAAASGSEPTDAVPAAGTTAAPDIEEIVVLGRYRSAATDVVSERLDSEVPMDFLGAESIARTGDGDVAAALRRVPGLTLAQGKYVYVRGLGERYSSTQLNGAAVPSPDLTRNVIPLDVFPTDIVDALAVQKGYSADMPAAFGGGNVDIRTKAVPDGLVFNVTLNTGWNSDSGNDGFTYRGGDDDGIGEDDGTRALPAVVATAIDRFRGSFSPNNILGILRADGGTHTLAEAELLNRQLATSLNRNVDIREKDLDPDLEGEVNAGYSFVLGEDLEVGVLGLLNYENEWRNRERTLRRVSSPNTDFARSQRTTQAVNITATANVGARYLDDHDVRYMKLALRNTEDDAVVTTTCLQGQFNDCFDDLPTQGRVFETRYEQRELGVDQFAGTHRLGDDTLDLLSGLPWVGDTLGVLSRVQDLEVKWYYSDARAETEVPGEVRVNAGDELDPATRAVRRTAVRASGTAADFRFSELEDRVRSYGNDISLPLEGDGYTVTLAGGYDRSEKARDYRQTSLGLGSTAAGFLAVAEGMPSQVFADANLLDPANGFTLLLGTGAFGTESYLAGQVVDAVYGKADLLLDDTWRISAGLRGERFRQVAVPVDLLVYGGRRITLTAEQVAEATIHEEELYPAVAATWMRPGFLADEFQVRFSWGRTVARPDLREVSASTFIDPLTEARVRGNPLLESSELQNFELRAEGFRDDGDSFSVSLFYKDISDPIETVQGGATEENILFNFVNADSAEVYGLELEGLLSLARFEDIAGDWVSQFYLSGSVTLSDSEISIGTGGGVGNITNRQRPLTQQSDWVANLQLGFDSSDNRHSATLVYNSFGERVFFAGINGFDDAYEQPFHSLDLVYSFYPTEQLSLKLKVQNLLDAATEIEQAGVRIIEQTVGTTWSLDVRWSL